MNRPQLRLPAILLFGVYVLYGFLLVPLNQWLATDAVLSNTILWDIVDFLMNLFEILGICAAFGFTIHGIYRYGARACGKLFAVVGGALSTKYLTALISLFIMGGSVDLTMDFTSYFFPLLIEVAELAALIFAAERIFAKWKASSRARRNAKKQLEGAAPEETDYLPIQKPFDRTNLVLRVVMVTVGVLTALRLVTYIVADIAFSLFGAAFTPSDIPVTLLYWVLMVFLPCFVGYLATLGCITLAEREREKQ